jgi:hypothetical protein
MINVKETIKNIANLTGTKHSGMVERIGLMQESFRDCVRTSYALLLEGEPEPFIFDTPIGPKHDGLRILMSLTSPGDQIEVTTRGNTVIGYQNETLSKRLPNHHGSWSEQS